MKDIDNKNNNNISFNHTEKSIKANNINRKQKYKIEIERKKLEKLFEKKFEETDLDFKSNDNKNASNNISLISRIKEFLFGSSNDEIKEENEKKKRQLKQTRKEEKIRKKREKERKKEEKILLDLKRKAEEKNNNKKKANDNLSNKKIDPKKVEKAEIKRKEKERKEALRKEKEEIKKEKLRQKYEEEARKKYEKEKKQIDLITEKRDNEKKLKEEREQAKKEKKEKTLLIKKAQEESREKRKKERKPFKEKVHDWYENLSIVKDVKNRKELQRQTLLIDFEGEDAVRSEEKIMYKYVAKNKETGKVENGMFAAFSKLDVHSFLLAEGYEVYEITPQTNFSKGISLYTPKFNASELDFFLTQLSTFLKSGITLVESVKILSKQSKKKAHKNIYKSIIYELTMGENFSEALSKQGTVFPRLLINMIKTSELTGDLPETLDDMADYYRETEKVKKQMISALTYPSVVLVFAFVILIFIMVSVVPQFVSIYGNMEAGLPAITVIIIKLSDFLKNNWYYVVVGVIVFILIFIFLFKTIKVFRSIIQSITMNVPVVGKIIIYNEVTMFTKTFASLLNHNVYITDCMEVLSKITGNEVYKMLIFDTITNLAKGEAISNSFKNHWAFPSIAYEMILTGERTGKLGDMMDRVAKYYQEQHRNAVNQIKAFIEPIMIVVLAAIVGVVLLSVILPMFDMYQNIG